MNWVSMHQFEIIIIYTMLLHCEGLLEGHLTKVPQFYEFTLQIEMYGSGF